MNKQSFTLIELLIVIIVISILVVKANFTLSDTSLNQAADQVISHINYTRHLALSDNKFQYYPISDSKRELNRTKYWFKQWFHFKITDAGGDIIYYIFTDSPTDSNSTTFNNKSTSSNQYTIELAKSALDDRYICGANREDSGNNNYPHKIDTYKKANLSKYYGIKKVVLTGGYSSSSMSGGKGNRIDLLFDNYGQLYMREGDIGGSATDINPYDKDKRKSLTQIAKISLCKDNNCEQNISICITPKIGFAYLCK